MAKPVSKASETTAGKRLAALLAKHVKPQHINGKLRRAAMRNEVPEGKEFAKATGLRYVSDTMPGIHRKGSGKNFSYVDAQGKAVNDAATLRRIRSLVLPPAWTEVWICPDADGHIQATGKDARGRKQYRYHPLWRSTRDETKFHRMIAFGKALPKIRAATRR